MTHVDRSTLVPKETIEKGSVSHDPMRKRWQLNYLFIVRGPLHSMGRPLQLSIYIVSTFHRLTSCVASKYLDMVFNLVVNVIQKRIQLKKFYTFLDIMHLTKW